MINKKAVIACVVAGAIAYDAAAFAFYRKKFNLMKNQRDANLEMALLLANKLDKAHIPLDAFEVLVFEEIANK